MPTSDPMEADTEVRVLEFPYPEAGDEASQLAAVRQFIAEYELPADSNAGDIIQHIMDKYGHACTFATLLSIAATMGADIQLHVIVNESMDVRKELADAEGE